MEKRAKDILQIYSGRRVLLTGHTGFKGSWLSFWLNKLGAKVFGLALNPPGGHSLFEAATIGEMLQDRRADIRLAGAVRETFTEFKPEIVFHMAAQSLVRPSYKTPLETLDTNIMGTANLLDACRFSPDVKAVVIVTSDKCYHNNEWLWAYRESDPMGGRDPYSASKGCAELVTSCYAASFFPAATYGSEHQVAIASARAGNVIGGGDWAVDRLLPDCFRAFMHGQHVRLRAPEAIRPWQHVLEPLLGYLMLGARLFSSGPAFGGGWNFAPLDRGDIWNVERVVKHICRLWGGSYIVEDSSSSPHEATMLSLDASKAFINLGWRPRWTVAEALEKCVWWYKNWQASPDVQSVRSLMSGQIESYIAKSIQD